MATVRRARPGEAAELTELAVRAKAHWGYDAAFMREVRSMLVVSEEDLATRPFLVLDDDRAILGFYGLSGEGDDLELTDLWVEPSLIRQGIGRFLFAHALETAREAGARGLRLQAEPFAEPFYLAMGCEKVGEWPSPASPGRVLPIMRIDV